MITKVLIINLLIAFNAYSVTAPCDPSYEDFKTVLKRQLNVKYKNDFDRDLEIGTLYMLGSVSSKVLICKNLKTQIFTQKGPQYLFWNYHGGGREAHIIDPTLLDKTIKLFTKLSKHKRWSYSEQVLLAWCYEKKKMNKEAIALYSTGYFDPKIGFDNQIYWFSKGFPSSRKQLVLEAYNQVLKIYKSNKDLVGERKTKLKIKKLKKELRDFVDFSDY